MDVIGQSPLPRARAAPSYVDGYGQPSDDAEFHRSHTKAGVAHTANQVPSRSVKGKISRPGRSHRAARAKGALHASETQTRSEQELVPAAHFLRLKLQNHIKTQSPLIPIGMLIERRKVVGQRPIISHLGPDQ